MSTEENCSNISPIRISIDKYLICISAFQQLMNESDHKFILKFNGSSINPHDTLMKFNWPFVYKEFHILLHDRKFPLMQLVQNEFLTVRKQPHQYIIIEFPKNANFLMTKPYTTACFEYRNTEYHSGLHCINKCKLDNYKRRSNQWSGYYFTYESEFHFEKRSVDKESEFISNNQCNKICGEHQNCFAEYFSLSYDTGSTDQKGSSN